MKIGIVGLGLIGASFAKAYREAGHEVYALDIDGSAVIMGKIQGFITGELTDDIIGEADLVMICLYPEDTVKFIEDHKDLFNKKGLVMDACGNKRVVCERAFKIAEESGFTFVGTHPMAGNKYSGLKHSRATMFNGAPIVIVPPVFDDMNLIDRVKKILEPCEFGSFCLSHADKHDEMIAFTSQMAHLVSNAYVKSPSAKSHHGFSAGSYKDMTRVAWLNPDMWAELFLENKDNLINEIDHLTSELNKYREAMVNDDRKELRRLLEEGRERKEELDGGVV